MQRVDYGIFGSFFTTRRITRKEWLSETTKSSLRFRPVPCSFTLSLSRHPDSFGGGYSGLWLVHYGRLRSGRRSTTLIDIVGSLTASRLDKLSCTNTSFWFVNGPLLRGKGGRPQYMPCTHFSFPFSSLLQIYCCIHNCLCQSF
jgi:hypothetical protein